MRLPILYTMSWPERIYCSEITWPRLDLCKYVISFYFLYMFRNYLYHTCKRSGWILVFSYNTELSNFSEFIINRFFFFFGMIVIFLGNGKCFQRSSELRQQRYFIQDALFKTEFWFILMLVNMSFFSSIRAELDLFFVENGKCFLRFCFFFFMFGDGYFCRSLFWWK